MQCHSSEQLCCSSVSRGELPRTNLEGCRGGRMAGLLLVLLLAMMMLWT
jgi:hypothetical protein